MTVAVAHVVLDEAAFDGLTRRHRRELHVHCYRMLASFDEAEDAVQETLLRAWQPYPDRLLDTAAPADDEPDQVAVGRETIELAFVAALQVLPPRQRATLVVRDVPGLARQRSRDAARLERGGDEQRAAACPRATLRDHLPARRSDWPAVTPAAAIATQDIHVTMPPAPYVFAGIDEVRALLQRAFGPDREGDWRLLPTAANRLPATASYLRRPGDTVFRAFKLDVLRVADGNIAEITTFGHSLSHLFGLPSALADLVVRARHS